MMGHALIDHLCVIVGLEHQRRIEACLQHQAQRGAQIGIVVGQQEAFHIYHLLHSLRADAKHVPARRWGFDPGQVARCGEETCQVAQEMPESTATGAPPDRSWRSTPISSESPG